MRESMADVWKEEGAIGAARRILLRNRKRFGEVSPDLSAVIEVTTDIERLEEWLERVLTAKTVKQVGIGAAP